MLLGACSLTRIRNQRPAGVVRHWQRTILHTCLPPVRLRLRLPVLVRTLITAARASSIQTLRKLATDRHEASTFPVASRSHHDRRSAYAQLLSFCLRSSLPPLLSLARLLSSHSPPCTRSFCSHPLPLPIFPMQHFCARHGAGSGRSVESLVATKNLTSRSRHLLCKSRPSARPAGPSLMRSARPNTQSPPAVSPLSSQETWRKEPGLSRPAGVER